MPRLLTRAGRYSLPAVRHSDRKSPVSGGDETGFLQCRDDLVYRLGRGLLIGSYGYVVGQVVSVAELITPASQSQRPTFDSAVASRGSRRSISATEQKTPTKKYRAEPPTRLGGN